jgi:hypothetical protein
MIRFSILIAVLLTAGLTADDMEVYKESSDRYFQEQVERLNGGSLREKIIAVENLRVSILVRGNQYLLKERKFIASVEVAI